MAVEELTIRARLRDELSRPLRGLRERVEDVADETDRLGDKARRADRQLGQMGTGVGALAGKLKGPLVAGAKMAAAALVGVGVAAGAGLVKAISLATDAGETASKFGTVFAAQRDEMTAWATQMHDDFGIATKDLQDAASIFGIFGKSADVAAGDLTKFSTDLVGAGLDLASFHNAVPEDVFAALRSGLSGEAEPLKNFGIFLSEANLNAFALAEGLGKTTKEMSEAEKVQLRQAYIMANLGDAEGDLARTSQSLANLQKALKGRIKEAGTAIGHAFLPYLEAWAARANDLAKDLMPKLRAQLARLPDVITRVGAETKGLVNLWQSGATYGETVAATLATVGISADGVVPIVNAVADTLGDLWTILTDLLVPAFEEAAGILPGFTSPLNVARDVIGFVADNAETLVPLVSSLITGFLAWKAATLAYNAVTAVANALTFVRVAATSGLTAAQAGATVATGGLAAGTATLNAIMSLNPIVLVVTALAALTAGLVIAYRRSETFRRGVDQLWTSVKRAATAIREAFGRALEWVRGKLDRVGEAVERIPGVGRLIGGGDTATSKTRGGDLAASLASHTAISGRIGAGPTITNALIGGGGNPARSSGDHEAGRAFDLKGSRLVSYAQQVRAMGGYAAFHGAGPGRHLHAAYGDTARPRARAAAAVPAAAGTAPAITIAGPLVHVEHAASDVDVEQAARRALEAVMRDRRERR